MRRTEEMKRLIQNEIQSISNLEERAVFRQLIERVFWALYETNEEMYERLENRVLDELEYDGNQYGILTGLMELTFVDPSHHLFSPVCEEDLESRVYKAGEVRKQLEADGKVRLATFFIQCDALELETFFRTHRNCSGVIQAGKPYTLTVSVEPSKRYLEQMEYLYHLFMKNRIPWSSLNAPYFFKMADVYITKLPEEISDDETIMELRTDFGRYNEFIHYNMVPVWNVRRLQLKSVGFPIACGDHESYEHTISLQKYGTSHRYLVEDRQGIHKVRQTGNQLVITGDFANAKKWNVYMVRNGSNYKIDRYVYPIWSNLRNDGFAERFHQYTGRPVKTKAELERFIRSYGLDNYLEYQDCALSDQKERRHETYSMNFFIRDEIRGIGGRESLTLYFKAGEGDPWILRDLMSFICTEVQELYPEYACGGILI